MKVFQIGFNKCGTSTIYARLDALGFSATHLKIGMGQYIATIMHDNLMADRPILTGLEDYDAFTDMEDVREDAFVEGYKFYPQLFEQVPDAMFILNIRDRERWVGSRRDHNDGTYAASLFALSGAPTRAAMEDAWRQDWDIHLAAVQALIPTEQLLVYNIETDDPACIDAFLGRELVKPDVARHANHTHSRLSNALYALAPKALLRRLPTGLKSKLRYMLRKRR